MKTENLKMDHILEILNREENTKTCWHPGCYYRGDGSYSVGPIGRYGPNTNYQQVQKDRQRCRDLVAAGIPVNTNIPEALYIRMKISKAEYDNLISRQNILKDVECLYETGYKYITNPQYGEQKIQNEKNMKDFETVKEEFQKFIDTCKQKGINAKNFLMTNENDDYICLKTKYPQEYFTVIDKENGTVEFRMHSQTDLYQYLLKEGVFEQRYPKWYRNGEY